MSLRVCAESGCPSLSDQTRCDRHRKQRRNESAARRRDTPQQQMYAGTGPHGRAWRRVRAEFLRAYPVCQDRSGCLSPAVHVHHVDGDPLGPNGLDAQNLEGLCARHHGMKTAVEQPGGWNAR